MSPQVGVDLQVQVQGGGVDLQVQVRPKGRTCNSGKDLTPWPQLANPWSKKPLGHRHTHVCEFAKGPLILANC